MAAAVLGDLWRRRQERSPILIVIDEAHNVCPAEPTDPLIAVAASAPSGSPPRPQVRDSTCLCQRSVRRRSRENILSQADNLVLSS